MCFFVPQLLRNGEPQRGEIFRDDFNAILFTVIFLADIHASITNFVFTFRTENEASCLLL